MENKSQEDILEGSKDGVLNILMALVSSTLTTVLGIISFFIPEEYQKYLVLLGGIGLPVFIYFISFFYQKYFGKEDNLIIKRKARILSMYSFFYEILALLAILILKLEVIMLNWYSVLFFCFVLIIIISMLSIVWIQGGALKTKKVHLVNLLLIVFFSLGFVSVFFLSSKDIQFKTVLAKSTANLQDSLVQERKKVTLLRNECFELKQDTSEIRPILRLFDDSLYKESQKIAPPFKKNNSYHTNTGNLRNGFLKINASDINSLRFELTSGATIESLSSLRSRLGSGGLTVTLGRSYLVQSSAGVLANKENLCRSGSNIRLTGPVLGPDSNGNYLIQFTLIH